MQNDKISHNGTIKLSILAIKFTFLAEKTSNGNSNAEYDTIPLEGLIDSRHGIVQ